MGSNPFSSSIILPTLADVCGYPPGFHDRSVATPFIFRGYMRGWSFRYVILMFYFEKGTAGGRRPYLGQ